MLPLLIALLTLSLGATAARAQTIINTERIRPQDVQGLFLQTEVDVDVQRGNARATDLKGSAATGYRGKRSWLVLVSGFAYTSSSDSVAADDHFAQLRYGWFLSDRTRTFHFVQIQDNREQSLGRRILLGSGLRHGFLRGDRRRLDLGAGLMWEDEKLNSAGLPPGYPDRSRDWRGDLLGVASTRVGPAARLSDVLYVEPKVDEPSDVRILNEARLGVPVVSGVELSLTFHWQTDSRPPPGVRRNDTELQTSLTATVR